MVKFRVKIKRPIKGFQLVKKHKLISIIIAYFIIGIIYVVTGFLHNIIIGKQVVFSLLISIPLAAPFWPIMIYADFKHIGIMFQDVITLISVILFVIFFYIIFQWSNEEKKQLNHNKN